MMSRTFTHNKSTVNSRGRGRGRNHFNVQRPVRDLNERVVSRDEALEKIQAQYEIERAKAEAKKKEKDAKKREEYLKRYQHVDQGRRLNEGLLDEAAGYNQVESLEEIRRRQQEKLRQEAAAYEERIREEQDRQKRKEEQKMKERLERNKNYDAGYRLNHGNNRGYNQKESLEEIRRRQQEKLRQDAAAYEEHIREEQEQQKRKEEQKKKELEKNKNYDAGHRLHRDDNQENTKKLPSTGALNKRPNQNKSYNTEDDDRQTFGASISPELLLEGETEEEFLQRQEEQLILEMIIQGQMELQAQKAEALEKNDISNDFEEINAQISPPKPEMKSNSEKTAEEKDFGHNKAQTSTKSEMNPFLPKKTAQGPSTSRWRSSVAQRLLNQPKATSNDVKISSTNPPENIQERNEPDQLIIKPAACILKNKSEAVLVLRPSTEELNQALARKLEVLDEADKIGYSASYKPHVEQKPLYSNNRFDIKSQPEGLKPTGAIPKNRPLSSTTVPVSSATKDSPSINTPAQREEPIDYQAELRAARLRFEQQYQERLKQIQEQNK